MGRWATSSQWKTLKEDWGSPRRRGCYNRLPWTWVAAPSPPGPPGLPCSCKMEQVLNLLHFTWPTPQDKSLYAHAHIITHTCMHTMHSTSLRNLGHHTITKVLQCKSTWSRCMRPLTYGLCCWLERKRKTIVWNHSYTNHWPLNLGWKKGRFVSKRWIVLWNGSSPLSLPSPMPIPPG